MYLPSVIELDDAISKRYGNSNYLKITDLIIIQLYEIIETQILIANTFTGLDSIYVNRDPIYDTETYVQNSIHMIN